MIKKIRDRFVCWFSNNIWDIHDYVDDVRGIPDHFGELKCERCGKIFKL